MKIIKKIKECIKKYYQVAIIIGPALIFYTSAFYVTSCKPIEQPIKSISKQQNERFSVRFVQSIEDNEAPFNRRKIYIIIDKVTKKEYIGITGVGISEIISSPKASQNE